MLWPESDGTAITLAALSMRRECSNVRRFVWQREKHREKPLRASHRLCPEYVALRLRAEGSGEAVSGELAGRRGAKEMSVADERGIVNASCMSCIFLKSNLSSCELMKWGKAISLSAIDWHHVCLRRARRRRWCNLAARLTHGSQRSSLQARSDYWRERKRGEAMITVRWSQYSWPTMNKELFDNDMKLCAHHLLLHAAIISMVKISSTKPEGVRKW